MKVLFVCGGNTCRSPMAEALARKFYPEVADYDSAGTAGYGDCATHQAIHVMKTEYGVDISGHRPKDIEDLDLTQYDRIVALEPYISEKLRRYDSSLGEKITTWEITDPYGGSDETYLKTARKIQIQLNKFMAQLSECPPNRRLKW